MRVGQHGICVVAAGLCGLASVALAEPMGTAFTYQGRLKESRGLGHHIEPMTDTCDFDLSLWDGPACDAPANQIGNTQSFGGAKVENGLFTLVVDFDKEAFNGDARWLHIAVECRRTEVVVIPTPCQELTPVPYALALPGLWTQQNEVSPNLIGGYAGNIVGPDAYGATIGGGGREDAKNRVYDHDTTIGGGMDNQAGSDDMQPSSGRFATVGGGRLNTASSYASTVGGGQLNHATGGKSTVGGGEQNRAVGSASTVAGGLGNEVLGAGGTIGGGTGNEAGSDDGDPATAKFATIGGGEGNTASRAFTTVAGGKNNDASEDYATVGGGSGNEATAYSATVGGGSGNEATDFHATVGGGWANTAAGLEATVGGGWNNRSTGTGATVAGGHVNTASGYFSTVPGGHANRAGGECSFAAGRLATVRSPADVGGGDTDGDEGTFVWADTSSYDAFTSSGPNQFLIRASGGVGIGTENPRSALTVGDGVTRADIRVGNGGMCIDSDGDCTPPGPGTLRIGDGGIVGANSSNGNVLLVPGSGNVGIGTIPNASAKLHVSAAAGNGSVILPSSSISAAETAHEPGVASDLRGGFDNWPDDVRIAHRTLNAPTSGYVLATATIQVGVMHGPGHDHIAAGHFTLNGPTSSSTYADRDYANLESSTHHWVHTVSFHTIVSVNAGSNSFELRATHSSGWWTIRERRLSLMFFPTSYGPVD